MIRQTTMFNSVYLNKLKMEFHIPYCYLKIKFLRLWKFSFTMKNSTYHFNFKHKNHHRVPYCSYLLIRALKQKWTSEVAQSCPTLCNPMGCSLPGSSIHGIFQAKVLEWLAISFSRGSSQPRDWTQVSHIAGRCFTVWATKEARNEILIKCHKYVSG